MSEKDQNILEKKKFAQKVCTKFAQVFQDDVMIDKFFFKTKFVNLDKVCQFEKISYCDDRQTSNTFVNLRRYLITYTSSIRGDILLHQFEEISYFEKLQSSDRM